jgi:triphosphoribosyl-dephospho-CoA synthetase
MIAVVDAWRAARILVNQHGADAATVASRRAAALLAEGDVEGERVFKMILEAVKELQRDKPNDGERVN